MTKVALMATLFVNLAFTVGHAPGAVDLEFSFQSNCFSEISTAAGILTSTSLSSIFILPSITTVSASSPSSIVVDLNTILDAYERRKKSGFLNDWSILDRPTKAIRMNDDFQLTLVRVLHVSHCRDFELLEAALVLAFRLGSNERDFLRILYRA